MFAADHQMFLYEQLKYKKWRVSWRRPVEFTQCCKDTNMFNVCSFIMWWRFKVSPGWCSSPLTQRQCECVSEATSLRTTNHSWDQWSLNIWSISENTCRDAESADNLTWEQLHFKIKALRCLAHCCYISVWPSFIHGAEEESHFINALNVKSTGSDQTALLLLL